MNRLREVIGSFRQKKFDKPRSSSRTAFLISAILALIFLTCCGLVSKPVRAQGGPSPPPTPPAEEAPLEAPERIEIQPTARDEEIRDRLASILEATGWFINPGVQVRDGVVFLSGQAETEEHIQWAGDLARNTQDVAAVVNQIERTQPSIWNIEPALEGLREMRLSLVRSIPLIGFSLLVLIVSWAAARLSVSGVRASLRRRLAKPLLVNVIARSAGVVVFLIGLFVVFQIAGLTSVALTVMGGTGLLGLILGIAFRDITENFLASVFLSLQNPFYTGDLVEINGIIGFVQALTTRATIIMTLDGNHVQIPNATVYKSSIQNYTSNPNRREDFTIGIGYEEPISEAQKVALKVLEEHPAVLKDPEPWVLVDNLGSATVNLRIYFWLDGTRYSWLKVKSSVIRLVKRAFQNAGISMPDEAREMIFPEGLSVRMVEPDGEKPAEPGLSERAGEPASVSTDSEGSLSSEAGEIEEQARRARKPEEGENLLQPPDAG